MSEQWTDERIKTESIGIVSRNLMTKIRDDMQVEIDTLRQTLEIERKANLIADANLTGEVERLMEENAQLRQQLAEAQAEIAELRQRLAASRKANSKLLKEANAEIKAFRGILGAEMGVLDSEIDDMIYDWMEAEDEVPSDDIEDN